MEPLAPTPAGTPEPVRRTPPGGRRRAVPVDEQPWSEAHGEPGPPAQRRASAPKRRADVPPLTGPAVPVPQVPPARPAPSAPPAALPIAPPPLPAPPVAPIAPAPAPAPPTPTPTPTATMTLPVLVPAPSRTVRASPGTLGAPPAEIPTVDPDGVRTAQVGTALWGAALVMLLPFYGWLSETGRVWWLWTCCAGLGLGLIAIDLCAQRRDRTRGEPSSLEPTPTGRRRR